jgi:hypothetical protein
MTIIRNIIFGIDVSLIGCDRSFCNNEKVEETVPCDGLDFVEWIER